MQTAGGCITSVNTTWAKTAKKNDARRRYATQMYTASLNRRARLAGMTASTYCKQVRSLAERRASARLRTLKKRTVDSRDADGSAVATAQDASVRTSVRNCAGGAGSLGLDVDKALVMVLGQLGAQREQHLNV